MSASPADCRVCGGTALRRLATIRPYVDFSTAIDACDDCGAYLAPRDARVYESLHATGASSYGAHERFAARVHAAFVAGALGSIDRLVLRNPKHRFVLAPARAGQRLRILELGCSRGALGAWCLLHGHDYVGMDISRSAVAAARRRFGPHFVTDLDDIGAEPFDLILHVGTIGCVEAPAALTTALLARLAPGGRLRFNAPNVAAARAFGDPWVSTTPPPDLVTLFEAGYWSSRFGASARVRVRCLAENTMVALDKWLRRRRTGTSLPAAHAALLPAGEPATAATAPTGTIRLLRGLLARTPPLLPWIPAEFGQLVELRVPADDAP